MSTPEQISYRVRHDQFQGLAVEILLVGIYTSIVLYTLHKIVSRHGLKGLFQVLVVLMMVMYACVIVHLAKLWDFVMDAFVDQGDTSESTLQALQTNTVAANLIFRFSCGALMFIGDYIMIWRCWRLYGRSWAVIILPVCLALGELGSLIGLLVIAAHPRYGKINHAEATLNVVQISFTLATTVLVASLIVYRIIRMGGLKQYRGIIEVIIESSALYAITIIVYMPFPFHPTLFVYIPNAILTPMPGIASTLIIARVTLGKGFEHTFDEQAISTRDHGAGGKVSSMKFDSISVGTRDEESTTGIHTGGLSVGDNANDSQDDTLDSSGKGQNSDVDEKDISTV